jgi:hypothetical protein
VLADLKGFQRRTAVWAFERMFTANDPTHRFLVADEVGLGKTHVAKGVIAQVIDHLQSGGDRRQDVVCDRTRLIGGRTQPAIGISALRPHLVVLDEFQRFKDLLDPDPANFAAELAQRLFNLVDPETGRPTRTLLLSATPYRMYATEDEGDSDQYADCA